MTWHKASKLSVAAMAWAMLVLAASAQALIDPDQVLVVYNSQSTYAQTVLTSYLAAHPDIPCGTNENVFNLNDTCIANQADISYSDFVTRIRNPIRDYLNSPGPSASSIVSIVLIRGIPHRIEDTDNAKVGDDPYGLQLELFSYGDATCSSVDAELVLLWQDLDSGENGGWMDSYADAMIDNPYHQSSASIQGYSRSYINLPKSFCCICLFKPGWAITGVGSGRLTPGDMYLVCRIDGTTAADAQAIITRAQNLVVNRRYSRIILDEDARTEELDDDALYDPPVFNAGDDYEETRDILESDGWRVIYNATADFIEAGEVARPVIAYASYGECHIPDPPGSGTYIDDFTFARGAIFNTMESFSGRAFNGLGAGANQEQVADFVAAGGTFGTGHVWEPESFFVADNEFLLANFLVNGLSWAEAAYSSIPALSWMDVVIGDPLARVVMVTDRLADFDADNDVDLDDLAILKDCAIGPAIDSQDPDCADTDFDLDNDTDMADFAVWQRCLSDPSTPAIPSCL